MDVFIELDRIAPQCHSLIKNGINSTQQLAEYVKHHDMANKVIEECGKTLDRYNGMIKQNASHPIMDVWLYLVVLGVAIGATAFLALYAGRDKK